MLAEYTVRLRQYAMVANPDLDEDDPLMPPPLSDEERYRMFAHVEIYGSHEAGEAYDELLTGAVKVRNAVADLSQIREMKPPFTNEELEERTATLAGARLAKRDLLEVCKRALDLLNAEMRNKNAR